MSQTQFAPGVTSPRNRDSRSAYFAGAAHGPLARVSSVSAPM